MIYPLSLSHDAPDVWPLTLDLIKQQLRIQHDEFDLLIAELHLPAAAAWAEGETGRAIATSTYYWTIAGFPAGYEAIRLPAGKATAVTSIAYTSNGATTTLRGPTSGSPIGTDYLEDLRADHGGILMPADTWPSTDVDVPDPVVITFTAGWTATTCPADIKLAMIRHIYENLDGMGDPDIDPTVKDRLISGWKLR